MNIQHVNNPFYEKLFYKALIDSQWTVHNG